MTAKDENGCTGTKTNVNIAVPGEISLNATVTDPNCFEDTGSIVASATGGTGTIAYSIDGTTFQGSGTFNGLGTGAYTVIAKDNNGCTKTNQVQITGPAAKLCCEYLRPSERELFWRF